MQVNRSDLESAWRQAWLEAPDGAQTFYEKLQSTWLTERNLNAGGSLSSLSRNGSSHSNGQPHPDHRTTVQQERVSLAALRYYETLQAALDVERDEAGELAIYTEALARQFFDSSLAPEYLTDFSGLRCA